MVKIGERASDLELSEWVQGEPTDIQREAGRVVLVEVFQVNCPGCFLYALPEAVRLHKQYDGEGLTIFGVATAFEDFDLNTLDNARKLAKDGTVVGETKLALERAGRLQEGRLTYRIPFPLAMDILEPQSADVDRQAAIDFARQQIPHFDDVADEQQDRIIVEVRKYLGGRKYAARTFDLYGLRGTPSAILIDKQGIVREIMFGAHEALGEKIEALLGAAIIGNCYLSVAI